MLSKPKILVCSDFSTFSDEAIKAAGKIRDLTSGVLHALHVSEHVVSWDWMPVEGGANLFNENNELDLVNTLKKRLEVQLEKCDVKGECHISIGIASTAIIQQILEKDIDLIVIAHKGKVGSAFLVGSLTEKIVASCPIPLLVIKSPLRNMNVAALVDPFGEMKSIINWAEELSILLSSRLTVVSLFPDLLSNYVAFFRKINFQNALAFNEEQKTKIIHDVTDQIRKSIVRYVDAHIKVEISQEKKVAYHLNSILNEEKVNFAVLKRHQMQLLEKILIGSETRRLLELFAGNLFILPP